MNTRTRLPKPQPQDAYNHFAREANDQQLAIALTFPTHLDETRLGRAVADLVREQPVLGCRFTCPDGHARFIPAASAALKSWSAGDAVAAALDAAAQPLDYTGRGVFRVDLVRGADGDALALRIDHVAADGQGAKQVAQRLAAHYSQPAATALADGAAPSPDRSARRLLRQFPLTEKVRLLQQRQAIRPSWGLPAAGEQPGRRHHGMAVIGAADFAALRVTARGAGATVNDVLLAAFYRALFAELEPPVGRPMVLNVSFDMRRYLDPADPMPAAANLSSAETALLARVDGEGFADTLARTVAEMARLKTGHPGVGAAVQLEYASRLGYRRVEELTVEPIRRGREHGVSFPFLSNFGVLDEQALRFAGVAPTRAVILPPVGHPPFMMLGPSSYAGELTLAIGYAEGETDPALVERILEGMRAELAGWSAASPVPSTTRKL